MKKRNFRKSEFLFSQKIHHQELTDLQVNVIFQFTVFGKSFRFRSENLKSNVKLPKYLNSPETEISIINLIFSMV